MIEIDMNKVEKEIFLKNVQCVMKNPKLYMIYLGVISGFATLDTNLIPSVLLVMFGYYNFNQLTNDMPIIVKSNKAIEHNIIRETEEYKIVLQLYKEYIYNISQLLKEYKFKDSIDKTLFIDELIHSGTLSMNGGFKYKIDKNEFTCVPELLGARIASGTGVCRHIAGLTTDLVSFTGGESLLLEVKKIYCAHPEISKIFPFNNFSHEVLGLIENGEKYIFDPTQHDYATIKKYSKNFMKRLNQIAKVIKNEKPYEMHISYGDKGLTYIKMSPSISGYYHINKNYRLYNYEKEQAIFNFEQAPWKTIENEELEKRKEIISKIFKETEYEREEFHKQHKDLMTELAYMNSILSPYSDEEKPRWVLHKK